MYERKAAGIARVAPQGIEWYVPEFGAFSNSILCAGLDEIGMTAAERECFEKACRESGVDVEERREVVREVGGLLSMKCGSGKGNSNESLGNRFELELFLGDEPV